MAENSIKSAVEFLRKIRAEKEVRIKFTKKDGTERLMHCTLDFEKIPSDDHPKKVDLPNILELIDKHDIVHVYDLEKHGWRSVPYSRSEWLEDAEGVRFSIKKRG